MATSFLVFGSALMPTSRASISVTTPPTFTGISTLVAQLNGSILASWSPATFAVTPGHYEVFIQAGTATGLFNSANMALATYSTSIYIFQLASGVLLVNGTTYYVGVRAIDAVGNVDSNTASLNAVSSGVQPGRSLAPSDISTIVASIWNELQAGHTVAGSFGAYLNSTVSNLASQSSVNNIPTNPLLTTDTRLNNLDASVSSRSTQVSVNNVQTGVNGLQSSVNAIPTNPLLTNDTRLNNLDATISSRATALALAGLISTVGTPAGASVSADIASVKSDSSGLRTDYTTARAGNLDFLDIAISSRVATSDSRLGFLDASIASRATQTQVLAIPTTPQLASVALSQYNTLVAAIGSIQNNSNFSGIVPQIMDQVYGTNTETYTFYASVFSNTNTPIDPDSQILNFTVKDNMNNVLQAQTAMTRVSTGQYIGTFTVTSAMGETDVVVFFDYTLSSVAYEQVRTSKILSTATDSANIAAIKAKTDNLPSDPASESNVSLRATQVSVNAIPTNPVLTTDARLNNLDATISSRSTASALTGLIAAVGTPTGASIAADIADVQSSVSARPTLTQIINGVLDENVENHLSGTSVGRTMKDAKVFAQIGL